VTPGDIRLDDLAEPVFGSGASDIVEAVAGLDGQISLSLPEIEAAAVEQTGLADFGSEIYRKPLEVLCAAIMADSGFSTMGLLSAQGQITRFLANRLLLADLWRRHPEIDDQVIARPIVIVGQPRSGTTHMHNLLSADMSLRSLPWWESLEPVPPAGETGIEGRRSRAAESISQRNLFLPHFDAMHEMTVDHVHEEIHLLGITGSTMLFDTMGILPSWREHYRSSDQTPHYLELVRILKTLQWLRGGERWVLKSPQHLEQVGPLLAAFPDAVVIFTHRDPVSIAVSMSTMIAYASRTSRKAPLDIQRIGAWWATLLEQMMDSCTRDRHLVPPEQSLDVTFAAFMADDMRTVEAIYDLAGQPFTPQVESAMIAYAADHPRGRHGRIAYDPGQFGFDADALRERFGSYMNRFDIPIESW
jgi:hypothetical protein